MKEGLKLNLCNVLIKKLKFSVLKVFLKFIVIKKLDKLFCLV